MWFLALIVPAVRGRTGRGRDAGVAAVAWSSCAKSSGKLGGVGGGSSGYVWWERLQKLRQISHSQGKVEEINRPSKLCGATNGPKIGEDITGLRKRDLNGLCVREIANIVQQHRVCSRKRR